MKLFRRRQRSPPRTVGDLAAAIEERGAHRHGPAAGCELLLWVGGDPALLADALDATLDSLARAGDELDLAFLVDGEGWDTRPLRARIRRFRRRRELRLERPTDLPQLLLDRAARSSRCDWLAFAWPGCELEPATLARLLSRAQGGDVDLVHGDIVPPAPAELSYPLQHGFLQMADLVPMQACVVSRRAFVEIGGFDPSPLLQRRFWWDFTLRFSASRRLVHVDHAVAPARWSWAQLPLRGPDAGPADLAARYVARGEERTLASFAGDLPPHDRQRLGAALGAWRAAHELAAEQPGEALPARSGAARLPLRLTLVSGLLDGHQNHLFFYGFFRRLAGAGRLTWRTTTYDRCSAEDLATSDLVVLLRPRFPEVPALLEACRSLGVPVLVAIDDNWPAAGREYPRFERLFTPGKPAFESFLAAVRAATAVLTWSEVLAAELRPLARHVVRLTAGIDLSCFAPPPGRQGGFTVGYAGSPRWEPAGFRGLASFLGRHEEARLLLVVHEVPEELRGIDPGRLDLVPWQHDYEAYARTLAAAAPDVLLAPLDATRFAASKVPFKFLDAAAVGAAGVYSRVPPYVDVVRDGETGLLVENDESAWEAALETLLAEPGLRTRIAAAAGAVVRARYSLDVLLPAFVETLEQAAAAGPPAPA